MDGVFKPLDKIAGSDLEQPQAGPQGRMPGVFYRPSDRVGADATGESHALPWRKCPVNLNAELDYRRAWFPVIPMTLNSA